MTARKRQNAELRKPAILKAFYEVIDAEGFENASVAKVAARAGIHPSLIIHYFGSKEKMVMALVDDVFLTYAKLFETLPAGGSARERLDRLLGLIWSRQWHTAANFSVVFSFLAMGQRQAEVAQRVRRLYRRYREFLMTQLSAFAEAGVIRVADPAKSADVLVSMTEGFHYFSQYHTPVEDFESHRKAMIDLSLTMLGASPMEGNGLNLTEEI